MEPTPQERAELATRQELVKSKIETSVKTLSVELAVAGELGMLVQLKEEFVETADDLIPKQILSVVRITAVVGWRLS